MLKDQVWKTISFFHTNRTKYTKKIKIDPMVKDLK